MSESLGTMLYDIQGKTLGAVMIWTCVSGNRGAWQHEELTESIADQVRDSAVHLL